MSKPALFRTTALYRTTANVACKRSRVSLIAASAAAAGVLSVVGLTASAAPWAHAAGGGAASTSASASGQPGTSPFTVTGSTMAGDGNLLASAQFDTIRSVATVGSASATAAQPAAKQVAPQLAVKTQVTQAKAAQRQAAKSQAKQRKATQRKAAKPYLVYDSVTPGAIPAGQAAAVYADGTYAASSAELAGHGRVLWIDTNGSDPAANALDVEPGDATPAAAAQWVQQRLSSHPRAVAIVYTMRSDWQQVKDDVAALPGWMQSKVRYWIADPTGVPHAVAGASATQWYWGNSYDITTANPDFAA